MSLAPLASVSAASPKGHALVFDVRPDTNDEALVHAINEYDEYVFAPTPEVHGWIIDIGAHIGIVTLGLAVDNPDTKIVSVEAIPENAELLARNVARNGLSERVFVESAGAGGPDEATVPIIYGYRSVGVEGKDGPVIDAMYVSQCRYIGNIFQYPADEQEAITEDRPGLSLSGILAKYAIERVALLKIDCEGCEWSFLTDPAVDRVDTIIGEYHGNKYHGIAGSSEEGMAAIHALLDATHQVEEYGITLFRAVHR